MNILANIKGIRYSFGFPSCLRVLDYEDFEVNQMPSACLIKGQAIQYAISKWVSPKRTRSYPYERVYNTLNSQNKRLTVIPVIKDEGANGDRDFVQWDTVSLMSLLDVYVIFAYYHQAERHKTKPNKITNQKFDHEYVKSKIEEISSYHSSALHWNLKEIRESLPAIIQKALECYKSIDQELNVRFHGENGVIRFKNQFINGVDEFMSASRHKAKKAQHREIHTLQPKEILATATKAKLTIKNYLCGLYYLTTDEIIIDNNVIHLIESKHSNTSKLPTIGDIKDALLKLILYCNLSDVLINDTALTPIPVLNLTSSKLKGRLHSDNAMDLFDEFAASNTLNARQIQIIKDLLTESKSNNFHFVIQGI